MAVFGRKQAAVLAWRDSHVVIPKGTTSIADDAFRNIGQTITSVIIPEGVASSVGGLIADLPNDTPLTESDVLIGQ